MAMTRYAALLRGINVGGRNKVPMAELRAAFTDAGYVDVATYIQSGNVVFVSDAPRDGLEAHIEGVLEARLGIPLVVVVKSRQEMVDVVDRAPGGFGQQPDTFHSDVIFLKAPLTASAAMRVVRLRDGVDQVWAGDGVLYFARLSAQRTKSRMSSIVGTPEYRQMTIRSWSTTTKLFALLNA